MRYLAILLLALLLVAAGLWPQRAAASATCSVTGMTNLAFGQVDPTGSQVDTSATLTYSCTHSGLLTASFITLCAGLGAGSQSSLDPRRMVDGNGHAMNFQIYKTAARATGDIWGPVGNATYTPLTIQANTAGTISGSVAVYGRVPVGQVTLPPGSYLNGFAAGNTLSYRYADFLLGLFGTYPASCQTGGDGGGTSSIPAFNATANIGARCRIGSAADLNFGSNAGLLRTNIDRTSSISMTCTNSSPWQVGLDNGLNAQGAARRMLGSGGAVGYELYRDSARQQRWGNTLNSDTLGGTGSGTQQSLTVYGRVPPQNTVPAGNYSDKITVTVTY